VSEPGVRQYLQRVWTVVLLRMAIDLIAVFLIVSVVALLAVALVAVAGASLGVNYLRVRQAAAIVGGIYVSVIWIRTMRRHWIIAGRVGDERPSPAPETPDSPEVAHAEPSATSSN
jgi:hypothetical protein